jgi:hypothetical protein
MRPLSPEFEEDCREEWSFTGVLPARVCDKDVSDDKLWSSDVILLPAPVRTKRTADNLLNVMKMRYSPRIMQGHGVRKCKLQKRINDPREQYFPSTQTADNYSLDSGKMATERKYS